MKTLYLLFALSTVCSIAYIFLQNTKVRIALCMLSINFIMWGLWFGAVDRLQHPFSINLPIFESAFTVVFALFLYWTDKNPNWLKPKSKFFTPGKLTKLQ